MDLSRFEGDFVAIGDVQLNGTELLALLRDDCAAPSHDLHQAIACYLSSSEGWDQALKVLRGAFASDAADAVRASGVKQDKHEINQRASEYLQRPALKRAGSDND
jgi:hypothetical protein